MRTFSLHINMKLYNIENFSHCERMHVKRKIVTYIRKLLQATDKTKHVWFSVTIKTKYAWQKLWKILSCNHLSYLLHLGIIQRKGKESLLLGGWEGALYKMLYNAPLSARLNGVSAEVSYCHVMSIFAIVYTRPNRKPGITESSLLS